VNERGATEQNRLDLSEEGIRERAARRRRFFEGNASHDFHILAYEDAWQCERCGVKAMGRMVLMQPETVLEACK